MVWCGLGLMALCGALCYTELAVRYPASGGEYVYLRHGFGDTAAFLYGCLSSVVMYPSVAAADGGLAALMMAAPRVSFAMAQTGQFLPLFGHLHRRFGTPANAILLQTGLALVALLFGTFDRILA
jgi:amino acid transporter